MESVESRLTGLVEDALLRNGVARGDLLVCAYSAGPDSTALSLCLDRVASGMGCSLALVHVDHGLRPEAELLKERDLARGFAASLGRELVVKRLAPGSVNELASAEAIGIEAAARLLRYAALEDIRSERRPGDANAWILTGHTADDQDETLVMRVFSGSGSRGLEGIRERRGWILRPLLGARKTELRALLADRNIDASLDSTNDSDSFLRNKLRKRLMPALASTFPGYRRALKSLSVKAGLVEDFISTCPVPRFREEDGGFTVPLRDFLAAHPLLRLRALEDACATLSGGRRIPFSFLLKAAEGPRALRQEKNESGWRIRGPGMDLRAEGENVFIERRLAPGAKKGYFFPIAVPGAYVLPGIGTVRLRESHDPRSGPAFASLRLPARLRSPRPHDGLRISGGTKPLSDLLAEWGLDSRSPGPPVLEDGLGIACVFGGAIGKENRFAERGFVPGAEDTYLGMTLGERGSVDGHRG